MIENLCHEELQLLNRGIGHLLSQPDLETDRNPFAPATIVEAFAESLETLKAEPGAKFTILKELNRASLSEINGILQPTSTSTCRTCIVMPEGGAGRWTIRRSGGRGAKADAGESPPPESHAEVDRDGIVPPRGSARDAARRRRAIAAVAARRRRWQPRGSRRFRSTVAARYVPRGPMPPTPSGYIPGAPIMATAMLGEGLARLQSGETDFDLGGGTFVQFAGIPEGSTTSCATCSNRRSASRRTSSNR